MASKAVILILILVGIFLFANAAVKFFPDTSQGFGEILGGIAGGGKRCCIDPTTNICAPAPCASKQKSINCNSQKCSLPVVIATTTTTSSTTTSPTTTTTQTTTTTNTPTTASTTTSVPPVPNVYNQPEKGLMLDKKYILNASLPRPSFSELKQGNFTILGTEIRSTWTISQYNILAGWIKSVHNAGFRTFTLMGIENISLNTMVSLVTKSAAMGVDVINFDELIARYKFNETQLQSIIDAGLQAKPSLQFIVNEYTTAKINNAYAWTAKYPSVRVATDEYDWKSSMDLGIQLAQNYGKRPLVWLIFVPGSLNFDCYNNLPDWINSVEQRGEDTLFWLVDKNGYWQQNWPIVMNFSTVNTTTTHNFSIPPNLVSNPSFEGATYQLDANNANFQDWEIKRSPDNGMIYTWVETANIHSGSKAFHWKTMAPNATNITLNYVSNSSKKFAVNESGYLEAGAWAYTISYYADSDISIVFYAANGTSLGGFWGKDHFNSWIPNLWVGTSYLWYPSSMGSGNGYIPKGAKYGKLNIYEVYHRGGVFERIEDDAFVRQWDHLPSWIERNSSAYSS